MRAVFTMTEVLIKNVLNECYKLKEKEIVIRKNGISLRVAQILNMLIITCL